MGVGGGGVRRRLSGGKGAGKRERERKERTNGRDSPIMMRNSNLQILIVLPQRSKVVVERKEDEQHYIRPCESGVVTLV